MPKKYSDLEEHELDIIRSEANVKITGMSRGEMSGRKTLKDAWGICHNCKHFQYAVSEFSTQKVHCGWLEMRLHEGDPMLQCSTYKNPSQMPLHEMYDIAWIIEPSKNKVGF